MSIDHFSSVQRTIRPVPDVSFIMPCYNEEENIGYTVPRLIEAFELAGHNLQLVTVNNGSRDQTAVRLAELAAEYPQVVVVNVEKNVGYGHGVMSGVPHTTAAWVGFIAADGQVDAEDVVRLYTAVASTRKRVLGKVRRRFRMDGTIRWIISVCYNSFCKMLWPMLGSLDVNGTPRILPRDVLIAMGITSKNWMIDPEMLVKAHYMGLRVFEVNVFARMRGNGLSHVGATTCWEFFKNLLIMRFTLDTTSLPRDLGSMPMEMPARLVARSTPARASEVVSATPLPNRQTVA
ncbi:MAG: glycosyltransferase family 2 protein [Anaerolineae bacterium]|nr:glycosyltransferase family 2 protein [Gemmatimonadaceae bacterium]